MVRYYEAAARRSAVMLAKAEVRKDQTGKNRDSWGTGSSSR
jgi:hypothetical protein